VGVTDTAVIFQILARDQASPVFKGFGRTLAAVAGGVVGGNALMGLLGKGFDFAKNAAIGFNNQLDMSRIAFTTMLGSGQRAQAFLGQLQAFAKSTPFEFGQLVADAQQMQGMGIAARDVIPDLRALGDSVASVGGSAQQVDQVTLAFDQMWAKGKVDLGNMNQLMQGGVPAALKIMAASYGITTGQMIKNISTGKVLSQDALPRLIAGIERGTSATAALGGMMDKQSRTFAGAMSNISDALTQGLAGAFRPFFDIVSAGAQQLGTWMSSPAFTAFGDRVAAGVKTAIGWGQKLVTGFNWRPVIGALRTVWTVITRDIVPAARDAWRTFGPLATSIGSALFGALGKAVGVLQPFGGLVRGVFGFVAQHATTFQALAVAIGAIVVWQKLWTLQTMLLSGAQKIATGVQWALNAAMDANPVGLIILAVVGLTAAFVYLWNHSKGFRDFWIGLWHGILSVVRPVAAWFAGPFARFFVDAWHAIADAGLWLWHHVLEPIWRGIDVGVRFVMRIVGSLIGLWLYLGHQVFDPVYRGVIKPVIDGIATTALWLWHHVLEPAGAFISLMIRAAGAEFSWLYHHAVQPAFHAIAAAASWAWDHVLHPIFTGVMVVVHTVGATFKKVFGAIGGFISDAFSGAVGIVKGVINTIIDLINGAIGFIDRNFIAVANKVPGVNFPMIPKLPHLASGGDIFRAGAVRVGERGPETVWLPAGARVLPNGATAGGRGRDIDHLELVAAPGDEVAELILKILRPRIRVRYRGDVQAAIAGNA